MLHCVADVWLLNVDFAGRHSQKSARSCVAVCCSACVAVCSVLHCVAVESRFCR